MLEKEGYLLVLILTLQLLVPNQGTLRLHGQTRSFPRMASRPEIAERAMDHAYTCTIRSREGAPLPDTTPGKERIRGPASYPGGPQIFKHAGRPSSDQGGYNRVDDFEKPE